MNGAIGSDGGGCGSGCGNGRGSIGTLLEAECEIKDCEMQNKFTMTVLWNAYTVYLLVHVCLLCFHYLFLYIPHNLLSCSVKSLEINRGVAGETSNHNHFIGLLQLLSLYVHAVSKEKRAFKEQDCNMLSHFSAILLSYDFHILKHYTIVVNCEILLNFLLNSIPDYNPF